MLDIVKGIAHDRLKDAHPERGGLLDSSGAQSSVQKAKATAASGKGDVITGFLLCIGANLKFL